MSRAGEQVKSSVVVCVGGSGFGQGRHCSGRESPAKHCRQEGTAKHSPVPWHMALLIISGFESFWLVAAEIWCSGHHKACVGSCCRVDMRYER